MKLSHITAATMVAIASLVSTAEASPIDVSGSLAWGAGTPTTAFSAANETTTFSFVVDNVLPATMTAATTTASSFQYTLNGVAVTSSVSSVTFFDSSAKGMFNLDLISNGVSAVVSIYGDNVGNVDSTWVIGPLGVSPITGAMSNGDPTALGTGTLSAPSPVPLPAALPLFGAACVGLMAYGMRRKPATCAVTAQTAGL